ncbi:MAG: peptidylprolyl isomerase, partial [Magnetovibrio sp.]|nr:peptidylprolyl isomerase [Magnetovibrio sp.]
FFIMFDTARNLNGEYTVWGKVRSGMEFVDKIKRTSRLSKPDKIIRMQVAVDADAEAKAESK